MANFTTIQGVPKPVGNRVLVTDMHFGEQKTASGLIITNDDGKTRGIYPRWGKVYSKGPENTDPYNIGDWVLIEHGRWTHLFKVEVDGEEIKLRMAETESILGWSTEKPESVQMGAEYENGASIDIKPEDFINR